jgi:NTP pyrophosphatase (non-canonical NTP hydrolase)
MADTDTTLSELRRRIDDFVAARDWQQFHTPRNLSQAIAVEAAELMEQYQWLTEAQVAAALDDDVERAMVAEELADVLIYALSLANALQVDVSTAVLAKLERNERRFPVERTRGRARR